MNLNGFVFEISRANYSHSVKLLPISTQILIFDHSTVFAVPFSLYLTHSLCLSDECILFGNHIPLGWDISYRNT